MPLKRLCAFLLFVIFTTDLNAHECPDKSKPMHEVNHGIETITCGSIARMHPKLGIETSPNAKMQVTRYENGKFIYTKEYTTDKNGFRKSPSSHKLGKKKHFLYIDGSIAFGYGLNDNETTTHWINSKSKDYEAYAVGYQHYLDQHTWLQFEQGDLPQKIKQKTGRAMLISYDYKIEVLAERRHTLPMISNSPNIQEDKNGIFRYLGRFADTTSYFNKFIISVCLPLPACKSYLFSHPQGAESEELEADMARLARLYSSIDKFYRAQFDVEEFVIGWTGTPENRIKLQKHLTMPILQLPDVKRYSDAHPTPEGARDWADYILANVLSN